jgi:hypothetical protein
MIEAPDVSLIRAHVEMINKLAEPVAEKGELFIAEGEGPGAVAGATEAGLEFRKGNSDTTFSDQGLSIIRRLRHLQRLGATHRLGTRSLFRPLDRYHRIGDGLDGWLARYGAADHSAVLRLVGDGRFPAPPAPPVDRQP